GISVLLIFHCTGQVNKPPAMPHVKTRLGIRAMTIAKFGQSMPRVEDRVLLTGRGRYVDDMSLPGQAHGVLVYSSHAHARIKSVDTSHAHRCLGILCILTGEDLTRRDLGGLSPLFMPEDSGGPKAYRPSRPTL